MFLPWDKDLTFGINNGLSGIIGNQDPYSHPFFGDEEHKKVDNKWNRLIDAVFELPSIREMHVRRLRTLMDQFLLPAGTSWIDNRVDELIADLEGEGIGGGGWLSNVNKITGEYLSERRDHFYNNHSINNPGYPDNAGIPDVQVCNPQIDFGTIEFDPGSGNQGQGGDQDQEYFELVNPNSMAVDISGWRVEGGIDFSFRPGTVIPAGGTLFLSPNVPAFLARSEGPSGGQQLLVQGNYSGHLSSFGETLRLAAGERMLVVRDVAAFEFRYGTGLPIAGVFQNSTGLSNGGERVELNDSGDRTIVEFTYDDVPNWPTAPDGGGPSLVVIDTDGDYNDPTNWIASAHAGGTPGTDETSTGPADFDSDGDVDGNDFLIWQTGFGQFPGGGATLADGDADSDVDGNDFLIWQANFGSGGSSSIMALRAVGGGDTGRRPMMQRASVAVASSRSLRLEATATWVPPVSSFIRACRSVRCRSRLGCLDATLTCVLNTRTLCRLLILSTRHDRNQGQKSQITSSKQISILKSQTVCQNGF